MTTVTITKEPAMPPRPKDPAATPRKGTPTPPYRGTRLRAFRIPDDVYAAAQKRAAADNGSVSAEVVAFLRAYGEGRRR